MSQGGQEHLLSKSSESKRSQPMPHQFSTDHRHCTCEQLWQSKKPRQKAWRNPLEFHLGFCSCLLRNSGIYMYFGYCLKYGGLSFSVAYFIVMAVFGLPTVILLAAVGQQSRFGPLRCWGFCPAIRGMGVAIMLLSALHTAPNMVVASEGVYMAIVLLESYGVYGIGSANASSCGSPLQTGFCAKHIHPNMSISDCEEMGLVLVSPDWGICGETDDLRVNHASEKALQNHYLWKTVGVIDMEKAEDTFAGPKLPTTDLLTGKMKRGFRVDAKMTKPVHWTLLTFVFTLAYCCLLLTLMVEEKLLKSALYCLSLASTALLAVVCIATLCLLSDGGSFTAGLRQFVSSSRNTHLSNNFNIWVDAVLLTMWNTGCSNGELINLTKLNQFGQDFINTSLLSLSLHCLVNTLHVMSQEIVIAFVSQKEKLFNPQLREAAHGYVNILMELQPHWASHASPWLSVAPLLCFAVAEVCDIVSFLCCCVESFVDVWPRLKNWTGVLHIVLFCMLVGLCEPLCMQFGGSAVYNFLYASWGWNCLLLLTVQLAALWHFLGPSGVSVLFKHLGLNDQLSRLSFWWRLCWFFYTPVLLLISLCVLIYDSVNFALGWAGTGKNPIISGPLLNLSKNQLQRSLESWWFIELLRAFTLLPVVIVAFRFCLTRPAAGELDPKPRQATRRGWDTQEQLGKAAAKQAPVPHEDVWKEISAEIHPVGE